MSVFQNKFSSQNKTELRSNTQTCPSNLHSTSSVICSGPLPVFGRVLLMKFSRNKRHRRITAQSITSGNILFAAVDGCGCSQVTEDQSRLLRSAAHGLSSPADRCSLTRVRCSAPHRTFSAPIAVAFPATR